MGQMKELYAKVAADSALQAKFTEIMKNVEEAGKEATAEKLIAFAKDAGYDVSIEEMAAYFDAQSNNNGELDDADLEMVAGGKGGGGGFLGGLFGGASSLGGLLNHFQGGFSNFFGDVTGSFNRNFLK